MKFLAIVQRSLLEDFVNDGDTRNSLKKYNVNINIYVLYLFILRNTMIYSSRLMVLPLIAQQAENDNYFEVCIKQREFILLKNVFLINVFYKSSHKRFCTSSLNEILVRWNTEILFQYCRDCWSFIQPFHQVPTFSRFFFNLIILPLTFSLVCLFIY